MRTPDPMYAAITADVIASGRSYQETGEPVRPRLLEAITAVNGRFGDALAVPFSITLGDEFQGLISNVPACPHIIYAIRLELSPMRCRVGVGIGTVVAGPAASTAEMEGAAFSRSRDALEAAKASRSRLTLYSADDAILERTANAVSTLTDVIQGHWTEKQWHAVRAYLKRGDLAGAASDLGVTFQAVAQRLRSTHWREIDEALQALSNLLKNCLPECSRQNP